MRSLKILAANRASHFYLKNKDKLWAAYRSSRAMDEAVQCLRCLLPEDIDVSSKIVKSYLDELAGSDSIRESIDEYAEVIGKGWKEKMVGKPFAAIIFCFMALRLTKPEVVIETGCATGWTSTLMLLALSCNQKGHLYSIDLRAKEGEGSMDWTLPEELAPGFLIPDSLRDRWTLILGDVRDHMIPLLQREKAIDAFYHDSDHTYPHMMWEYSTVWPHLRPGGLLISDDVGSNPAFWDFAAAVQRPMVIHRSNLNFAALLKVA